MMWTRSKHIAKHSLKWFNFVLVLPFLTLTLCILALLYTAPGLKIDIWLAQHFVPGFSVERSEGSLLGGHKLYNIRYQQPGLEFIVQESELSFNSRCFLTFEACIKQLAIDGLTLRISENRDATDTEKTTGDLAPLVLPFPLTIAQFTVYNGNVDVMGTQLSWQKFSTGIEAWGNKLQLTQPHWDKVTLALANTTESPATEAPFVYNPPALTDFSLPLSLFIDQFSLTDFVLRQSGNEQHVDALSLTLHWRQHQLDVTQFELLSADVKLQASAKVTTIDTYPLQARANLSIVSGELAGQHLQLQADGDLATLQLFAQSQGPIEAEIATTLNVLQSNLPHQVIIDSSQLQWPLGAGSPEIKITGSKLQLEGDLLRTEIGGHFSFSSAFAPDAAAEFKGHASINEINLETLLIDTLGGQINANARVDWQKQVKWQSDTRLRNIQPGLFWPEYAGVLNGEFSHNGSLNSNNSWALQISKLAVNGTLRDYTLALDGSLSVADNSGKGDYQLHTPTMRIQHADNTVTIKGSVDERWQLALLLDIPALEQSINTASGKVSGEFRIEGERDTPQLIGKLDAKLLNWHDVSLNNLALDTTLRLDTKQKLTGKLTINASDGRYQLQDVQQVNLSLEGNEQQHQLRLSLQTSEHQANLALSGALSDNREVWQAELQQAQLNSLLGPWQLSDSATIELSLPKQRVTLSAHCWQQQSSNICISAPLVASPKQADIAVKVTQFDLAALAALLPSQSMLTGLADGQLAASWRQGKLPNATLSIAMENGEFSQQLDAPLTLSWQQLRFNSELVDDKLQNNLQLNFADDASLVAKINVAQLQSGINQLDGQLKLHQFALNFLQPLLGELTEFNGELSSELAFSGNLNTPLLNGEMALSKLRIKGKRAPIDIDNAELKASFTGQQANLAGLITTPKGEVNVSGDASWQNISDWTAAVRIKGDELRLQVPQAKLQIAPDLTITATPALTTVKGSVTIPNANINIDNLPQNAVELSDDLVLLDKALDPLPQEDKAVFNFQTDINVILGNKVKLSAFGLKTRLNGKLRVRQQPQQVLRINGDVSLQDGTFRAYGQDLLIRKGKMSFNGPADLPFLNIEAIRNPDNMEDDVIVGIRVNGPADNPNVVIFSEPAKAQANALSYLLMGRDLESGSTGGNAVTTGLIGMTLASSSKVVGEIGEAFGLQDLALDTAGAGDNSQVTVSGYLSRDLQLKYGYGIFNAVGEFTLRYRLMRRLYLEAVSGLDNAVDLLYKFEFD